MAAVGGLACLAPLVASGQAAIESVPCVRRDVELLMGFEACGAPAALYARLQDEMLFGAGAGFFTVRLARALGRPGRVLTVEVSEEAVAGLKRRVAEAGLANVETVLGRAGDPRLASRSLDAALIVNAYHEMASYPAMLARLLDALRPGGRLVLVEPWSGKRRAEPRARQIEDHLLAPEVAEAELRGAGFEIASRRDDFITRERRFDLPGACAAPGCSTAGVALLAGSGLIVVVRSP